MTDVPEPTLPETPVPPHIAAQRIPSPAVEPEPGTFADGSAKPVVPATSGRRKRTSRWDRPREPRDWRWAVGHVGRALITLGILMFGFVAYQLWGTGIQTRAAQNDLKSEFNQYFEENNITPDTIGPATTTSAPPTTAVATSDGAPVATDPATTLPPETTTTVAPDPVPQNYGDVQPGDAIARIKIPKIDLDFLVVAGVSAKDLGKGVGHFANTVSPGQLGNSALAGHRTSHLAPFYDLDDLKAGDEIQITTKIGGAYVFIVTDSLVVNPSDYHVVTDSDPNVSTLTLITCTPIGTSKQRLVVHATLDTSRSSDVGIPEPYYGQEQQSFPVDSLPDETLPGDDTLPAESIASTPVATQVTPESAVAPVVTSAATIVTEPAAVITEPATVDTVQPDLAAEFGDDAFSQGWFDDGAAWPHVVGWALLFGLIWVVCYQFVARRRRNLLLGIAVAFVPIVIVLYFMYENINRLLPAAI